MNTMVTPYIQQDLEVAACSDEDTDWEESSQHPNEIGDAPFTHVPYETPDWQRQRPLHFSMNAPIKAARNPGESRNDTKWAIYQDTAVLDASGARGEENLIRLLRIKAGTGSEALHCQLVKRPLWDAGDYAALSYSWGTEPPSSEIYIESRNTSRFLFPVSPHLFSALKRLRNEHSVMNVWIDAICINQSNIVERAAQVQIMAQIFNAAREVRVWLGEYSGSGDEFHTPDCELFWSLCQHPSPWWTRLWIIQECAYAASEPLIMLGACSMTFQQLIERWQSAVRVSGDLINSNLEDALTKNLKFLQMPFDASVNLAHRLPLSQRLRETTGRHCSDPHDKIYALLSLIDEEEEKQLIPDYRKPFMDLMLEVLEVLRGHDHWDETRDSDLLGQFKVETCVTTALTGGRNLKEYTKALEEASQGGYTKIVRALLHRYPSLTANESHIENGRLAAMRTNQKVDVRLPRAEDAALNAGGGLYGTALQAASREGHEKVVQMLLAEGAHVNARVGHFGNALYAASQGGHEKVVQMLLAAGAEVNAQGGHFGNALQAASRGGHETVVQMLLAEGADVNARVGRYGNALYAASQGGYEKVVQMLLAEGADVNAQGVDDENALYAASQGGHEKVVQMLLSEGADVSAQGGRYGNALQAASQGGHEKVVQMLLAEGAHVNARGGRYGNALQAASLGGHEKVVQMLLAEGAHVNARGGRYINALQAASLGGYEKVVQMLLAEGADVNAQGGEYSNALYAALQGGHEKVVQMLLAAGAEVNAQGGHFGNALQAASRGGHENVVQMLLAEGADVNARVGRYGNALYAASQGGHEKVVQMLLAAGAEVNAQGGHFGNVLQAASSGGYKNVVQMLRAAGAR
jgi:ankyrin repeat protein